MTGWQWETEMEWLTVRAGLACCGGVGGVQCGVRRAAPLTHSLTERVDTLPTATLRHCDTLDTDRDCAFLLFALITIGLWIPSTTTQATNDNVNEPRTTKMARSQSRKVGRRDAR